MKGRNKKGISAIVATVLIIAITVGVVAVVGNFIIGMVRDNLQGGTQCSAASLQLSIKTQKGLTCYNENAFTQTTGGDGDSCIQNSDCTENLCNETKVCEGGNSGTLNVNTLDVQIFRDSGDINLTGIYILPSFGGNTVKKLVEDNLPGTGETRVLTINVTESIDEVSIIPVIKVGNTNRECSATEPVRVLAC